MSQKFSKRIDEFTNAFTQEVLEIIQSDASYLGKWNLITEATDNKTADLIMLAFYAGQQQGHNEIVEQMQHVINRA